jgi:predicted phosphodiesterase
MKLAITTDTHYGFDARTHKIHEKFLAKVKETCDLEKVDALIHSGDWIANNQHQLPRTWKMFRKFLGDLPILTVLGNHDFWQQEVWNSKKSFYKKDKITNIPDMVEQHYEWASENKIHLLQGNPYIKDDVAFYGFNGWYNHPNPPTNDAINMCKMYETAPTGLYFSYQANKELEKILIDVDQHTIKKKVCVTHFPPYSKNPNYEIYCANTSYLDFISEKFDLLIVGHSHQTEDWISNSCRVVNAGTNFDKFSGGYNKPNFLIIDI